MLMILARLVRSESFWAVAKVRSPHTGPEFGYPRTGKASAKREKCMPRRPTTGHPPPRHHRTDPACPRCAVASPAPRRGRAKWRRWRLALGPRSVCRWSGCPRRRCRWRFCRAVSAREGRSRSSTASATTRSLAAASCYQRGMYFFLTPVFLFRPSPPSPAFGQTLPLESCCSRLSPTAPRPCAPSTRRPPPPPRLAASSGSCRCCRRSSPGLLPRLNREMPPHQKRNSRPQAIAEPASLAARCGVKVELSVLINQLVN